MMKHIYYKKLPCCRVFYYEGVLAFEQLKIGTELELKAEPENRYDPNAVAICLGEHKLGYVPRNANYSLSKFLNAGHHIFETRVQYINKAEHPENQLGVVVFLKENQ